ncbi:MAG: hypothetical protein HY870_25135 [Chloroflexi bacterium]|nr:hypothetical protein [Chloroflexota bacterium]
MVMSVSVLLTVAKTAAAQSQMPASIVAPDWLQSTPGAPLASQGPDQETPPQANGGSGGSASDPGGGCGWAEEYGTPAHLACEDILKHLVKTYGIHWEAPTDPAIRLYDFSNRALRRWKLADAKALQAALDAWSKALGGIDTAKRELELETLIFKLRGQGYMLIPGDLGEYIDEWDEIDLAGPAIQAVDFAHELAHRWERHHPDTVLGKVPTLRTLRFTLAFYTDYDSHTDRWTSDGGGWTDIARGSEGRYGGARPVEDFAETASHVVMQTKTSQQYRGSARYQFMVSLMLGLKQP